MASSSTERSHPRLPIQVPVEFRGPKGTIQAATLNVSRSGMFIKTPRPLPDGSRAFFTIRPAPNTMHFHLEGEVVWSKSRQRGRATPPNGMGVRFLDTRIQDTKTLDGIFSVLDTIKS